MINYLISPSLLSADFARLGEEAVNVLEAGADMLHFDVMDNHFVPNLTIGPMVCSALRKFGITAPIDVHLMTEPVDRLIKDFAEAGATYITIHPEASEHVGKSLDLIREYNCKAGLAINPDTPLHLIPPVLGKLDMILIMAVKPGFGGQQFISSTLDKIRQTRKLIDFQKREILLSVDGGIKEDNMAEIAKAGADTFVAGSAIFSQDDYGKIIRKMRAQLKNSEN